MDVLAEERNHQLTDILTNLYALIAVSHARIAIINIFVNHFMLKLSRSIRQTFYITSQKNVSL